MAHQRTQRAAPSEWLRANYPDFVAKDQWPPSSPLGLSCVGCNVGCLSQTKPSNPNSGKHFSWSGTLNLPQGLIDKAVKSVKDFSMWLKACVEDGRGGHFKYSKWQCSSDFNH